MQLSELLSSAALTAFVVAAVRELRRKVPAIDGLLVWVAAGLLGVLVAFAAAVLTGPVEWRSAVLRGLGYAVAAVGAVGTAKALTQPGAAPAKPAAETTETFVAPPPVTPETHGERAMQLDFATDPRPSGR